VADALLCAVPRTTPIKYDRTKLLIRKNAAKLFIPRVYYMFTYDKKVQLKNL